MKRHLYPTLYASIIIGDAIPTLALHRSRNTHHNVSFLLVTLLRQLVNSRL